MEKRSKTVMLTLRIPTGLRSALRTAAKGDHRSVNGLVVSLLWRALQAESKDQARSGASASAL
jgi:hypothetical protein